MDNSSNEIKVIHVRKIYELLSAIRHKHHGWLTSKSITALQNFITGYMQLGVADSIYHPGEPTIKDFELWFFKRARENKLIGNSYQSVMLYECKSDEERAFEKFFELLDEFMANSNAR
jgi:hypothetical protein